MMQWAAFTPRILYIPLLLLAGLVFGLGLFMTDIRDMLIHQPRTARIERAMEELAGRERTALRNRGGFQTFGTQESPIRLKSLGVDIGSWPSEDYLFEASLQTNKSLRLRALPRPDAVRDLRVKPRIYVVDVAASGGVISQGWVP